MTPNPGSEGAWAAEWALLALGLAGVAAGPFLVVLVVDALLLAPDLRLSLLAGTVFVALAGSGVGLGLRRIALRHGGRFRASLLGLGLLTTPALAVAMALPAVAARDLQTIGAVFVVAHLALALPTFAVTPLWVLLRLRGRSLATRLLSSGLVAGCAGALGWAVSAAFLLLPVSMPAPTPGPPMLACSPDHPINGLCPEGCIEQCMPSCDVCMDCGGPGSCRQPLPGEPVPHWLSVELPADVGAERRRGAPARYTCASGPVRQAPWEPGPKAVFEVPGDAVGPCVLEIGFGAAPERVEGLDPSVRRCARIQAGWTCE